MIFPNRPPQPEIRPGMGLGYLPGAMGYLPGAMGYAPGRAAMGYTAHLGQISDSMEQAAMLDAANLGITQSDLDLLSSVGATDSDITDLLNGNTTVAALYAKYGVQFDTASTSAAAASPASSSSTPAPQSPPGSTLLFTCAWTAAVGNLSVSPNNAIAALTQQISKQGFSVVSSQVTSSGPINYGISVTLLDTVGHDTMANAASVPTALMQGIVGNNFSSTPTLTLVSSGASSGGSVTAASAATDLTAWFENNAAYIGVGVVAVVALNAFLGGGRRR